ncbi:MAG: hypothetical protein UH211_07645 [Agathobacter sp.]|nr:hypothetical protein [Agathobacter sp.]
MKKENVFAYHLIAAILVTLFLSNGIAYAGTGTTWIGTIISVNME